MSGTATLPSFVAEIDRLSDELELFGFPRMLPPEFMPIVFPNGKMEMESVKVLDLLHTLMDSLWTMIQAKHRDRELHGDEGDTAVKLSCELKALETSFQRLQTKVKKKSHEVVVLTKESETLKACQRELTARVAAQEEVIRMLRSQTRHLQRASSAKMAARDLEIEQLKERVRRGLGAARPTPCAAGMMKAARKQEARLKEVLLNYQRTTDVLVEENIVLQQLRGADDGAQEIQM